MGLNRVLRVFKAFRCAYVFLRFSGFRGLGVKTKFVTITGTFSSEGSSSCQLCTAKMVCGF